MRSRVAIILITWESETWLRRCLHGVRQQTLGSLPMVVVDNGSTDQSRQIIRDLAPDARLIANEKNRGFAAAANQAFLATDEDLVLLLNPDVFLEADYVERLVAALDQAGERFGAATGKLLRGTGPEIEPTGRIDSLGIRMTRTGRHFDIRSGDVDDGKDEKGEVFGVSGAAALLRRTFLNDVAVEGEVFDEDFFAFREDADIAWRGRTRGWRAIFDPGAIAYHVRRVTPEVRSKLPVEINYHSVKNRFLLRWKNSGWGLSVRNAPFVLARDLVVLGATLTIERSSLPAWSWLWKHRKTIARKRRLIQQRRTVSDRALARWFE